ncbi:hypothetical protein HNY73_022894 [Argiope bruennichi]|uniref:Uncharacterized protein n=1 Tax=Argiope bruennichi TaxID=94029 RepID=A0A8T0E6L9_ARGBR|nr:hypothetical protein HNY73_022894 [Argiope bruennichi]
MQQVSFQVIMNPLCQRLLKRVSSDYENKEIIPLKGKTTSYSPESSVIDIESEPDSDASEKSIRSECSEDFVQAATFKDCLAEKLKPDHRNRFLFDQNLRNPYCYQLHAVNPRPVANQTASTQTEPKSFVAKKTVSTQMAGKKSHSTQTVNSKKHASVLSPSKPNYSCFEDSNDSPAPCSQEWHGCGNHIRFCKAPKAFFDANEGDYMQNHSGDFAGGGKRVSETNFFPVEHKDEESSNRRIFGVSLKHVQIP